MNRQAREDFGFWASEDYALMAKTGRKKEKTSTRRSGPNARNEAKEKLVTSGLNAVSSSSRGGGGISISSDDCNPCTIS